MWAIGLELVLPALLLLVLWRVWPKETGEDESSASSPHDKHDDSPR